MKVFIEVIGCSRRKAEVARFLEYFRLNGYTIVDQPRGANYILISTCAFKKDEEDQSFERVRALKKFPAKLVVYGCLPEIAPTKFESLGEVKWLSPKNLEELDGFFENIVVGIAEVPDVPVTPEKVSMTPLPKALGKLVRDFSPSKEFVVRSLGYAKSKLARNFAPGERFQLFISRGCLGKCTYCAIKRAVGTLKSKPAEVIFREFDDGVRAGHEEVVLLGDDVGAYGVDIDSDFPSLVSRLAERGQGKIRVHIEEIHPKWMLRYQRHFEDLVSSGRVASILCPIQSGHSRILQLMGREHTAEEARGFFSRIRAAGGGMKLTTQIIAGFPTETESEFEETLAFVAGVPFDSVTVFAYDDKEKVPSSRLEPKVSQEIIEARVRRATEYFRRAKIECHLSCPK